MDKKRRSADGMQLTPSSSYNDCEKQKKKKKKKNKIAINKGQEFEDWKTTVYHFMDAEVDLMCSEVLMTRNVSNNASFMSLIAATTQTSIMPYMVRAASQIGGHSLSNQFLYDAYKNYQQLKNLLDCVSVNRAVNVAIYRIGPSSKVTTRDVAFAVLTACAQHVKMMLSVAAADASATDEEQDVFALATVTPAQQTKACKWLAKNWSNGVRSVVLGVGNRRRQVSEMPVFNSDAWWVFVKNFLRLGFGFGLRTVPANKNNGTVMRAIVANSFYANHKVDVLAVIANRREQVRVPLVLRQQPSSTYNGRKFGQYPATVRNCDRCHPGSPPVLCVRQFGTQWLCVDREPGEGGLDLDTPCHRDYRNPISVGYLDVDPPPSSSRSLMPVDELKEEKEEKESEFNKWAGYS
jgi:hypothetical protein